MDNTRTTSKASLKYSLLTLLYFLREIRKDDLYTFGVSVRSPRATTTCYQGMVRDGLVKEEQFFTSNGKTRYYVVMLTEKGEKEFLDINYNYNDLYYEDHAKDFTSKTGDAFNSYNTLGNSRNGNNKENREKLHARNRAMLMMYTSQIAVLPDEKPSLVDLVQTLTEGNEKENQKINETSFYYKGDKTAYEQILSNGIYYTKNEFLQYLGQIRADGQDQIYGARFTGILVSSDRCIVVYTINPKSTDMIKLTRVVEYTAVNLIREEMKKISDFQREVGVLDIDKGNVDALVVVNGESLIYTMVAGRHIGKGRYNAPSFKPKLHKDKANDNIPIADEHAVVDQDYKTIELQLSMAVDGEELATDLKNALEDIDEIEQADVQADTNELSIMIKNEKTYPKEAILRTVKQLGFTGVVRKKEMLIGTLLNAECNLYQHIYAVTPNEEGRRQVRYIVNTSFKRQQEEMNKLLERGRNETQQFEIVNPKGLYAGRVIAEIKPFGVYTPYKDTMKVTYIPVLELKQLREMCFDVNGVDRVFGIISFPELYNIISKCIRKKIYFYEIETTNRKVSGLKMHDDVAEYGYNGLPYGQAQVKKHKQVERRHVVNFEIPITLHTKIKHMAEANGIYTSTMMRNMLEAVINTIGDNQANLKTAKEIEAVLKEFASGGS